MKIVFLDLDGVLNNLSLLKEHGKRSGPKHNDNCSPENVEVFNTLLEKFPETKIVFSSTWRCLGDLVEIEDFLRRQGVNINSGQVIGKTPFLNDYRGNEIQEWITDYGPHRIEKMVILDDNNDMGHLTPYLVQTDIVDGITETHIETIIEYFKS